MSHSFNPGDKGINSSVLSYCMRKVQWFYTKSITGLHFCDIYAQFGFQAGRRFLSERLFLIITAQ